VAHVARRQVTGLLLAGGKSVRMGTDKALMDFEGAPMAAWCAAALAECAPNIVVSSASENHANRCVRAIADAWPSFTVLRGVRFVTAVDRVPEAGPLAGLAAGLEHAATEQVVVSACDSPLVPAEFYRRSLALLHDAEVVAPHLEQPEALISAWRRAPALAAALRLLPTGRGPRALLDVLKARLVQADELRAWGVDPARMVSANTPIAMETLRALRRA
jgi:molybdopterin-guanine dinucleotide biosynthesis protein A